MNRTELKITRRVRRKRGLRKRIFGVPGRPRLSVHRSNKHMYAQLIDDLTGRTLVAASTSEKGGKADNGGNCGSASEVGKRLGERATSAGLKKVIFDRSGYRYHGRVKALADGAREAGLEF